jgi:hypothetical protein
VVGPLPARPVVHLDAGYDYPAVSASAGRSGHGGSNRCSWGAAPIQVGRRRPVERTHAWANQYGKLRWGTERRRVVVGFWLLLAFADRGWSAHPPRLDPLPLGGSPPSPP